MSYRLVNRQAELGISRVLHDAIPACLGNKV